MAILDQVWLDIARELSSAEYGEKEAVPPLPAIFAESLAALGEKYGRIKANISWN